MISQSFPPAGREVTLGHTGHKSQKVTWLFISSESHISLDSCIHFPSLEGQLSKKSPYLRKLE